MTYIDPIINTSGASQVKTPQEVVMKQVFGLAFKEILSSLTAEDDEMKSAFKNEEDKDVDFTSGNLSGITTNISGYPEQFVDSFINNPQGQQLLNQFYRQYAARAERNYQVDVNRK